MYHIDTSNVLFILSGAFVGLDKIIKQRVAKGVGGLILLLTETLMTFSPSVSPPVCPQKTVHFHFLLRIARLTITHWILWKPLACLELSLHFCPSNILLLDLVNYG